LHPCRCEVGRYDDPSIQDNRSSKRANVHGSYPHDIPRSSGIIDRNERGKSVFLNVWIQLCLIFASGVRFPRPRVIRMNITAPRLAS
jgi:hypothetical protein